MIAALLGYDTVCWSVETQDGELEDPVWMLENLKQQTTGGSVVLLHDRIHAAKDSRYFNRESVLNVTEGYLDFFAGIYRFATILDMFREAKPERVDWDIAITDGEREERRRQIEQMKFNSGS